MRTSIKIISLIITIVIFIALNIYWFAISPTGEAPDTSNPVLAFLYYSVFFIILTLILVIVIYFYIKTRRKTRIKL